MESLRFQTIRSYQQCLVVSIEDNRRKRKKKKKTFPICFGDKIKRRGSAGVWNGVRVSDRQRSGCQTDNGQDVKQTKVRMSDRQRSGCQADNGQDVGQKMVRMSDRQQSSPK